MSNSIPTNASPVESDPMLRYFNFDHLPADLRAVSARFQHLAIALVALLPRTPERTVALRKLLESKDAAVRCAVDAREEARS